MFDDFVIDVGDIMYKGKIVVKVMKIMSYYVK